ncbi:DNA internalization-related competence protein ComEC/Rec2 [Streptococcus gordonii]|uniref:DNA internalization-related competence protein celB n=1 Tax=Streptococcus gordonii (strain Challis / ATCC 35105 / BCRC 15272 / CH1 / DL1 / V288) TaxID=467705 RepID=A8AYL9_STRGC|nr:DNA internalization-related competence protein ComEC/Rec2 [Streptococcus gordonii]ABV09694.1 DNA internalization-related competence protein celB [Streptococcus gordonii str. Challis substr. CH1]MBZ2137989.1 DNA internalization-related competence protein ComEC/Rec2 [Streptococcus gordonii]QGS43924.1 DNA internalization-related competence protein ComEC/Rec2 [Streptococcus gordonii]VEE22366.1 DNA internalization-related competence protein celB [Streptococcus gordonii]VTS83133.1 DNA internaliza
MSQWIKKLPLAPIYLCFLLVWLYFAIYSGERLAYLGYSLLIARLIWHYPRKKWLPTLAILIAFSFFFYARRELAERAFQTQPAPARQVLVLPDTVKVNGDSLSFRGRIDGRLYQLYYKLASPREKKTFQKLTDLVTLEIEAEFNLAEERRNFSGFDYQAYLKSQGIYRTVKISRIMSSRSSQSTNPFDWLSVWRRKALVFIKSTFPSPMSHYMTGLLFGDLDIDFAEMNGLYSSLGIIHLFALSGMQVGFFMDVFRKILLRIGLRMETVDWLQFPLSFLYAGLTGFSVSVVRSLVQKLLSQFGVRRLDNFAMTMLVLMLLMPSFLLTTGGVLSCAYAFIITMLDFEDSSGFRKAVLESLSISLGILPLLIYYFAEFQPWSILLTFLFSIVFDTFMLPLLSLIFLISPLFAFTQVNVFFQWLEMVIRWVASLSTRPIILGQPNLPLLIILLLVLALLYDFRKQKKIRAGLSLLAILLFFLSKHPLQNEITVVDIGQGDSIFLRDVRGRTIVIDTGGRVEIGKKEAWQERVRKSNAETTLIPYLKSRGVDHLDQLVLTHTDTDHMGDMLELAKHFSIREIYVSKGSMTQVDFVDKLKKMKAKVHVVEVGDRLPIFDSALEVLYPLGQGDGGNDDSIVLYGEFFRTKFLFTGDLEAPGEGQMVTAYPDLRVDVLKAGHHGSKGSSSPEFLEHIKPKLALISAGKNNRYQHPHKETLDRFEKIQTKIFRTDEQGAIRFKGWNSWQIETVR